MTTECKVKGVKRLMCIEYPGFVHNVSNALSTLNGIQAIEHTFNTPTDRLELRFRPEDKYSHPTFGDRVATNALFIKIIKRTKSDGTIEYESRLIGIIETTYRFKSLADFQYLPMIKIDDENDVKPQYMSIIDKLIPKDPFNVEKKDFMKRSFNAKTPLFVLPTLFSRFDSSIDYYFRDDPKHKDETLRKEIERQDSLSVIGRTRKSRSVLATLLNWSDPVPEAPSEQVLKQLQALSINDQWLNPLMNCFEERPIWSRNALVGRLGCERVDIKLLLPKIAYYFINGPFRCLWIKFGYNPKTCKNSKIYQTLDFRVKQVYAKNMSSSKIRAKRSIYQYQLPLKKKDSDKIKPKESTISSDSFITNTYKDNTAEQHLEYSQQKAEKLLSSYLFRPGLMPAYRQLFYQLCDIQVPEVQQLIHSNNGKEPDVCDERDGWCVLGTVDKIRVIMSNIIDSMLVNSATTEQMNVNHDNQEVDDIYNTNDLQNDEFLEYFG